MVEDDNWKTFFKELRPSFKLPSRYELSHRLLDNAYTETNKFVESKLAEAQNLSIMCDGWTNIRNEGIINFIVTTPEPVFVKCVETATNKHTSQYIKELLEDVLKTYNPQKFVCIITDNASNMRKAAKELEEIYPHIISFGCFAHTLHLLCGDILKIKNISTVMAEAKEIIKVITRTHILVATFNNLKKELNINVSLHLPVATRWGSHVASLKSMVNCKSILKRIAIDSDVNTKLSGKSLRLILDDTFWFSISNIITILEPITSWITKLESDKSTIHLVYTAFSDIERNLQHNLPNIIKENDIKICMNQFNERRTYSLKPIHYAAELLNPNPDHISLLTQEERCAAMAFIEDTAKFMGLSDDSDDAIILELGQFLSKQGIFSEKVILKAAQKINLITFWGGYCKELSILSKVAVRLLSMPTTSAAVERSFSSQSIIHTKKRNRLTTERAIKLNYVRQNSKLLKSDKKFDYTATARENEMDILGLEVVSDEETNKENTIVSEMSADSDSEENSWHSNFTRKSRNGSSSPEIFERDSDDEILETTSYVEQSQLVELDENILDLQESEETDFALADIADVGKDYIIHRAGEMEEKINKKIIILNEVTNYPQTKICVQEGESNVNLEGKPLTTADLQRLNQFKFINGKWIMQSILSTPIKKQ